MGEEDNYAFNKWGLTPEVKAEIQEITRLNEMVKYMDELAISVNSTWNPDFIITYTSTLSHFLNCLIPYIKEWIGGKLMEAEGIEEFEENLKRYYSMSCGLKEQVSKGKSPKISTYFLQNLKDAHKKLLYLRQILGLGIKTTKDFDESETF